MLSTIILKAKSFILGGKINNMKHLKKATMLAVLAACLLGTPALTACGGGGSSTPSSIDSKVTLQSIEVTKMPTKVEYITGETFDPTGMEITAHYSDGSTEVLTQDDYSYPRTPLQTGQESVEISYRGRSVEVPITVTFVLMVTSIEVEQMPTKTTYVVGETFDPTGMRVTGRRNDGTKVAIQDYTYDKTDPLTLDDRTVTITYEDMSTTINIQVVEEQVTGIRVTKNPTKINYIVGETFDPTGIEISTITNAGNLTPLTSEDFTYDKHDPLTLEDTVVTFTYGNFTTTLNISVSENALTGIEITTQPTKVEYKDGETFDPTGMVVTAHYADESTAEVTEYTYPTDPLTTEDTEVTITYVGFTATVQITVSPLKDRVNVRGTGLVQVEAEDLDTSKATLRDDFIQAGRTFIENGDGASGGANICGYNPGSIFEIPVTTDQPTKILIRARMSDTELNYKINDGVRFKMDEDILTADDVTFTYAGTGDYWNWKEFNIATVDLEPGEHVFSLESISQRPNLDRFDFYVLEYGDEVMEKELTSLQVTTNPTKTSYKLGETFDPTGMVITGVYNTGETDVIEDYTVDTTTPLDQNDTYVTVSVGSVNVNVPISVCGLNIQEAGEYKHEAERVDTSHLVSDWDGGYIENSGSVSSNGQNLGHIAGGYIEIPFVTNKVYNLKVDILIAFPTPVMASDKIDTLAIDGEVIEFEDVALDAAEGNQYWNYQTVTISKDSLAAGEHTFRMTLKGGGNYDYFNFIFTE